MAADGQPGQAPGPIAGPEVIGDDRTSDGFHDVDALCELARSTLIGEGVAVGRLDLMVVDIDEMEALNVEHMGHEGPTDVLSFPLDGDLDLDLAGFDGDDDGSPIHLGDIVVCPEVARRQAPSHTGTEGAEFALLVIHGVLHVLGHDHAEPDERARMVERERHHLAALGHVHPDDAGASVSS